MQLTDTSLNAYGFGRARRIVRNLDLVEQREKRIKEFVAEGMDALTAMLRFDFEEAPVTTNAKQLERIGVRSPFTHRFAHLMDATELRAHVVVVVEALADINVYLLNSDHMTDRELLVHLWEKVMLDEVRDLPPGVAAEFIDLNAQGEPRERVIERDRWLPKP